MILNFKDFINENKAPDDIDSIMMNTDLAISDERIEEDMNRAVINNDLNQIKRFIDDKLNNSDVCFHILILTLKAAFHNKKEICSWLLNLDVMSNPNLIKNDDYEWLFNHALNISKSYGNYACLNTILNWFDRNGVERPPRYLGKKPNEDI